MLAIVIITVLFQMTFSHSLYVGGLGSKPWASLSIPLLKAHCFNARKKEKLAMTGMVLLGKQKQKCQGSSQAVFYPDRQATI